jgi:hypothetical protein
MYHWTHRNNKKLNYKTMVWTVGKIHPFLSEKPSTTMDNSTSGNSSSQTPTRDIAFSLEQNSAFRGSLEAGV